MDSPDALFSLARRHAAAGELEDALAAYQRATGAAGAGAWYAHYQSALLHARLGHPWPDALQAYLAAYQSDPARAEPLYRIGIHHQGAGEHAVAHLFLAKPFDLDALLALARHLLAPPRAETAAGGT